jgi:hypothetical protein
MKLRGGEFSTGTTGNFQPELTQSCQAYLKTYDGAGNETLFLADWLRFTST